VSALNRKRKAQRAATRPGKCRPAFNLSRLRRPSAELNPARSLVEDLNSRTGRKRKPFETIRRVKAERRYRIRHLRSLPPTSEASVLKAAAELAAVLETADGEYGAPSLADPVFFREIRRRLIAALLRQLDGVEADEIAFYTIVAPGWGIPGPDLDAFHPKHILEQLRVNLIRTGKLNALDGWVFAFVHGDHDPATDTWWPHVHAIVVGEKRKAFEAIRDLEVYKGGKGKSVYRPIAATPVSNFVRQVSYQAQAFGPSKPTKLGANRKRIRMRGRSRLAPERLTQFLRMVHRHRFQDFTWFHGIAIRNGRLVTP
jgi:hypothetical protein